MLSKKFLSAITTRLSRRSKHHILKIYCSTSASDNSKKSLKKAKYADPVQKKKIEEVKLRMKKLKRNSVLDDEEILNIINYVHSVNPDLVKVCTKQLKLCKGDIDVLYFIDRHTAAEYASMIRDDLSKNTCFVAELNPGYGILTTELLKIDIPFIHLYEGRKELFPIMNAIHNMYPERLDLRKFNVLTSYKFSNKVKEEQMQQIFQGVETKKWEAETSMQIIGATSNKYFFPYLVQNLLFRSFFMSHGRPVFYFAITPSLYYKYTCDNSNSRIYTSSKVMFQAMFNYELLGTLSRNAFLPWPRQNKKLKSGPSRIWAKEDYEHISVIKIEPKINLYSQLLPEDWIMFSNFIRHHLQKRRNRVIPELEKWIPGCGIRLIAKDYTIFTQFGDLTPTQLLELFKEFKSWPEYSESNFLTSMNYLNVQNELGAVEELADLEDNLKIDE